MRKIIGGAFTVAVFALFLFLLFVALTRAQSSEIVAAGGNFVVEKAAVAGGGTEKQMSTMNENGTAGQTVAGHTSSGGAYSVYSGFWVPESFVPTAAHVSVSGRITTSSGAGVRNIIVTLTAPTGMVRSTLSSSLGYYTFDDVAAGEIYLISVYAKRYTFPEPTRTVHVADEVTDADFIAIPSNE